jgi:type I restriction enzyme S subunit
MKERYELPQGWIEADFEQCFDIPKGPFIKIPQKQYLPQGKFPIIDQGSDFITGYTNKEKELFKGDLPVIIFGDHTRIFKFIDFNFAIGADGTKILRAKKGIEPKYLFYYLKSIELPNRGYSRHYRYLRENKILLAPAPEQKRIVAKIESLFDRINKAKAQLTKIPPLLKKFRQSVLAKAFSGELTGDWRAKQKDLEPASKLLERIRQERKKLLGKKYKEPEPIDTSDLPELPEGWEWVTLGNIIIDAQPGFASGKKDVKGGLPHLRMNNIDSECNLNLNLLRTVPKELGEEKYLLKKGDVLICHTNSQKLIGKTAVFNLEGRYAFSNHLTRIRFFENTIKSEWIWYYITTLWQQGYFETRCKQWVNQATIERDTLLQIPVPVPPYAEQNYTVEKIQYFFSQASAIEKSVKIALSHCEKLSQSILTKAFRGELVEQNPNDEPAEALLKKIDKTKH